MRAEIKADPLMMYTLKRILCLARVIICTQSPRFRGKLGNWSRKCPRRTLSIIRQGLRRHVFRLIKHPRRLRRLKAKQKQTFLMQLMVFPPKKTTEKIKFPYRILRNLRVFFQASTICFFFHRKKALINCTQMAISVEMRQTLPLRVYFREEMLWRLSDLMFIQ